ncbi:hypothetical protein FALBO_8577 [Fusarium albosuccineum]|uniref:F-box domain-containing protein n=1 Tax=Fusarium albosuccineum TaxID=1237068 RepID=A0A8H4PBF6_9HYPO|nr:hypothetical protein FALBO_8577 [Fusarium albosuccineum]
MSGSPVIARDMLSHLPNELLVKVFSHLSPIGDGHSLISTSKKFYNALIIELYRKAGKELDWAPLFIGARDGNMRTLELCRQAGAQMDLQCVRPLGCPEYAMPVGSRPLNIAIDLFQTGVVMWLLFYGANPNQTNEERLLGVEPPLKTVIEMTRENYHRNRERASRLRGPDQDKLTQKGRQIRDALTRAGARASILII